MAAFFERHKVGPHTAAADEALRGEPVELAEVFDDVFHLVRELTRRHHHYGLDFVAGWVDGAGQRDAEGDGLAGACLGEADEVFAIQETWEGCLLDRCRVGVAQGGNRLEGGVADSEAGKCFGDWGLRGRQVGARPGRRIEGLGTGAATAPSTIPAPLWGQWIVGGGVDRLVVVGVQVWRGRPMRGRFKDGRGCGGSGRISGSGALSLTGEEGQQGAQVPFGGAQVVRRTGRCAEPSQAR